MGDITLSHFLQMGFGLLVPTMVEPKPFYYIDVVVYTLKTKSSASRLEHMSPASTLTSCVLGSAACRPYFLS